MKKKVINIMGKKCVVWGTHYIGQISAKMAINAGFDVCAFCSSTVKSQGKQIDQIIVISPEKLKSLCCEGKIDGILIGTNQKHKEEITKKILDEFPKGTFIIHLEDIEKITQGVEKQGLLRIINNLTQCKYSDFDQIMRDLSPVINQRYFFLFLHTMHELIKTQKVDSIVTGSSYGLYSIAESAFQNGCINFSMFSQDLYYSYLHAKNAIENSMHKIKRCFIILGYYAVYQDLSMQRNNQWEIRDIFYPLFNDAHNATLGLTAKSLPEQDDDVKPCIALIQQFFAREGNTFFNAKCPIVRDEQAWISFSDEEKKTRAQVRANSHNKLLKYTETLKENKTIIDQFVAFLVSKQVTPIFVIPPFTKEYCTFLSPTLKKDLCAVLGRLPYSIQYVDMNEKELWETDDFVDPHHMSSKGSKKFSRILNDMFCMES